MGGHSHPQCSINVQLATSFKMKRIFVIRSFTKWKTNHPYNNVCLFERKTEYHWLMVICPVWEENRVPLAEGNLPLWETEWVPLAEGNLPLCETDWVPLTEGNLPLRETDWVPLAGGNLLLWEKKWVPLAEGRYSWRRLNKETKCVWLFLLSTDIYLAKA